MRRIVVGLSLAFALVELGCSGSASLPGGPAEGTPAEEGGTTTTPGAGADAAAGPTSDATTSPPAPDATTPVGTGTQDAASTGAADARATDARVVADARVQDTGATAPETGAPGTGTASPDGGCGGVVLGNGPINTTATHLDIGVHDPSMIWDGTRYYLFATGGTLGNGSTPLGFKSSADMLTWGGATQIFTADPPFIAAATGSAPNTLWAADISYYNGLYHVYYAGSTFRTNNSVIGLATTASLQTPQWTDRGLVIQSKASDNFNAIDPNLTFDQSCQPWLAYGSFWDGIKMRKVDATTGLLATDNTTTYSLASRGGGAIEAASIISHNGFYYLFASFDTCCQGVNSTYRSMVGRAPSITGPYTNKAGASMMTGAAEQLLATAGRYIGPGGGTAWRDGNTYLYAYHYYDLDANGASKLQVRPITFDATDWVVLGDPLFP